MEFLIILVLTSQELVILPCLEKVKYLVALILPCLEVKKPISTDSGGYLVNIFWMRKNAGALIASIFVVLTLTATQLSTEHDIDAQSFTEHDID